MNTIWKFPCPATGKFELEIPAGAMGLTVQEQNGVPCIWAVVDPTATKVLHRFEWVMTGGTVPTSSTYHGTVQLMGGEFVVHLFRLHN